MMPLNKRSCDSLLLDKPRERVLERRWSADIKSFRRLLVDFYAGYAAAQYKRMVQAIDIVLGILLPIEIVKWRQRSQCSKPD